MSSKPHSVSAFAPATVANLGVGFDVLGMAIAGPGDEVTARCCEHPGVHIESIVADFPLSTDANENIAGIAVQALLKDHNLTHGVALTLRKGIPLGSGLGGSAASAVAALVAVNALLPHPLTPIQLLPYAVYAEGVINGAAHADNVAPALLGGLVLCGDGHRIHRLPSPPLSCLALHVDIVVKTQQARQLLPKQVTLSEATTMTAKLGAWVHALHEGDQATFAELLQDNAIEQSRLPLWPHYQPIKQAVQQAGAKAMCVSGSGPCLLAWVDETDRTAVQHVMVDVCEQHGWSHQLWLNRQPAPGAYIVNKEA